MAIKICLDAGHYGKYNQSPCNKKYYESEVMWKLTEYLKEELLTYKDCAVITTRTDQTKDLAVYSRGQKAKGCDLFISNHSNAVGNDKNDNVDYVVVYRSYKNKNNADVLALRLAKAIAETMGTKQAPRTATRKSDNGEREYYGVLRGADDAGCPLYFIIENSFHTNSRTTEWLLQDANLKKLAQTQSRVIAEYYGLSKKISMPDKTITPDSSPEDINWAKDRLNKVLPAINSITPLHLNGKYDPEMRIAVLMYWLQLGWGSHMQDDGTRIGKNTRKALAAGRVK